MALALWIYLGVGHREEKNDNTNINNCCLLSVYCRTGFQVCSMLYFFYPLNDPERQDHGASKKEHSTLSDDSLDEVKMMLGLLSWRQPALEVTYMAM